MKKTHSLLRRQLKRYYGDDTIPDELEKLIDAVNKAYWDSDSDRKLLERALELSSIELLQANSELQAVIKGFPDIFLRLDSEGTILVYKRGEIGDIYPWSDKLVNKHFCEIFGELMREKLETALNQVRKQNSMHSIELAWDVQDLKYYEIRLLPMDDNHVIAIIRDITERKLAEEQLIYYSLFDPLTNLYNRAYFEKEMHRFQTDSNNPVGLIICDVDNLKTVNDTYGHDRGDTLLMEIASVLRKSLRKQDVIARIGGDEFAILLPNSDLAAVESTCQRIDNNIMEYNLNRPDLPISVSTGFSLRTRGNQKMDEVFKDADDKMYQEKYDHHRSLSSGAVRNILETMDKDEVVITTTIKKYDEFRADLNLKLGTAGDEVTQKNLLVYLRKSRQKADSSWVLEHEPIPEIDVNTFRNYLKSLIIVLNVALDSMPVDN